MGKYEHDPSIVSIHQLIFSQSPFLSFVLHFRAVPVYHSEICENLILVKIKDLSFIYCVCFAFFPICGSFIM